MLCPHLVSVRTGKWECTIRGGYLLLNSWWLSSLPGAKSTGYLWREKRGAEKDLTNSIVCGTWHQLWQLLKAGPPGMKQESQICSNQLCRNLMLYHGKPCLPIHARARSDPSHLDLQETLEGKFPPRAHQKIHERPNCNVSLPCCCSHEASLTEHWLGRRAGQCRTLDW